MGADDLEKKQEELIDENTEGNTFDNNLDNNEFDDVKNILEASDDSITDLMSGLNEEIDSVINGNGNADSTYSEDEKRNNTASLEDMISEDEINRLMQEDTESELEVLDTEVINNVGVYDSNTVQEEDVLENIDKEASGDNSDVKYNNAESDDNAEGGDDAEGDDNAYENLEEFMKDINTEEAEAIKKPIIIAIAVLISLIIISILLFILCAKKIDQVILEDTINKEAVVARYKPDSEKNTLFVDLAQEIDGKAIVLEKIKLDRFNTYFYFKNKISPTDYIISLSDNNDNFYALDFHFYKDSGASLLRVDPIKKDATKLYLTMESLSSNDKVMFVISINANVSYPETRYINDIVKNDFGDFSINITYATVSKDSIHIDYSIEVPTEKEYGIKQGLNTDSGFITLSQDNIEIPARNSLPIQTEINNRKILGRMDFMPPKSMDSPLVMRFDKLYKEFPINKSFDIRHLNTNRDNLSIPLGDYELFLEGMPKFDNKYVFVFSVKDLRIDTTNRPDTFNNVKASLDIEIEANTKNGEKIKILPTDIKSSNIGTDIIFELTQAQNDKLAGLSNNDISVNIKSMLLDIAPINIPISIERMMDTPITYYKLLDEAIEKAFISRLKYKSGESTKMNIKGFSKEVLNNDNIMKYYNPMKKAKDAKYSVNIISRKVYEDNIDAIVQEAMEVRIDGKINIIYIKHKIRATFIDNELKILSDVIIK